LSSILKEETNIPRNLYFIQNVDTDAFGYEWTEHPFSLFEPNAEALTGFNMRKGNKAEYVVAMKDHLNDTWVEENTLTATNDNTIFILDAMAFVHQNQDSGCSSFSDLQRGF